MERDEAVMCDREDSGVALDGLEPDALVDRRGVLDEEVFAYKVTKNRKVFITWYGKQVTTLSGRMAEGFISSIAGASGKDAQLIMAKATGHFKHGNERSGKY